MNMNHADEIGNSSDSAYADILARKLDSTILNLNIRKDSLAGQIESFTNLLHEIDSSTQEKFVVFIGDGYFVEKVKHDAILFLEERIESMNVTVQEIIDKLHEANETKNTFEKFKKLTVNSQHEEKLNDEGLPYMDIQEELDENDNVLSTKINSKEISDDYIQHRRNVSSSNDSEDNLKTSPNVGNIINLKNSKESSTSESMKESVVAPNVPHAEENDQIAELFEDMHIPLVQNNNINSSLIDQDKLLEKIDNLRISPEDKFKLKQATIEQYNALKEEEITQPDSNTKSNAEESLSRSKKRHHDEIVSSLIKENDSMQDHPIDTSYTVENSLNVVENNLIELELIADLFDDTASPNIDFADDEEWDFEFDDDIDDNEEEDDDLADEILYGDKVPFLANSKNEKSNKLLWDQVLALRTSKEKNTDMNEEYSVKQSEKKKSVRFAKKLEIKEIENISDSLKNMEYAPKLSLFKQRKHIESVASNPNSAVDSLVGDISEMHMDISQASTEMVERLEPKKIDVTSTFEDNSEANEIKLLDRNLLLSKSLSDNEDTDETFFSASHIKSKDKYESISTDLSEAGNSTRKISKFKKMKQEGGTSLLEKNKNTSNKPHSMEYSSIVSENVLERESMVARDNTTETRDVSETSDSIKEVQFDYKSVNADLDTMANAYILGMYDDDITTEGPVVSELDDFEKLNKLLDSDKGNKHQKEPELNLLDSSFDPEIDEIERQDEFDDEDDGPILMDSIVENDYAVDEYSTFGDKVDDDLIQQEVISNYHRLRQKIVFDNKTNGYRKGNEELELEPIDESGNPIKISRFKATRLR